MKKLNCLCLMLLFAAVQTIAQNRVLSGRVSDQLGNPVPGASIVVKGTRNGTTSSSEGAFSLSIGARAKTLVVSSINFATTEVDVPAGNNLLVTLNASSDSLSELVVTSLGIRRDRKTLGYSTPVVSGEDLTAVRNTNISNSLTSKVAGLRTSGTGGSFTGSAVLIRGYTSMTGSSAPLYVVDGVPIDNSGGTTANAPGGSISLQFGTTSSNRVLDINPDDVDNIVVLKDATATALYGSRGAGGVILVTTKKGRRANKSSVTVNGSYGLAFVNRFPVYQNIYSQGSGGKYVNNSASSWGVPIMGQTVTNAYGNTETLTAYPNNVKDIFQTAHAANNSVSFQGGNEKTTFRLSYNNADETYVIRNNKLMKNSLSLNVNSELSSKLTVGGFVNFTNTTSDRTQQGNQLSNPLFRSWFTPRSYNLSGLPYYDAAGNELFYGAEDNPYWAIDNIRFNDETNRVFGNLNLKYKFAPWLYAEGRVGGDAYSYKAHGFDEIGARGGGNTNAAGTGGIVEVRNLLRNVNSYLTLNFQKQFGNFNVLATAGNEVFDNYANVSSVFGTTLSIKGFDQMKNAATFAPSFGTTQSRTIGLFGDVSVEYRNWASLDVKARNDWPSTLPLATRSTFYPAISGSINLTNIFSSIKTDFVNNIKLRGGYGVVGRGPGPYNTENLAVTGGAADGFQVTTTSPYNGLLLYTISNAAGNPNLKPEFTKEFSVGADIDLWKGRLGIEATYYHRHLTDGLFSVPTAPASGITSVFQNAGELTTDGLELGLRVTPIQLRDFTWTINANYTQIKTIVTRLAPGVSVITLGGFTTPNVRLVAGDEFGAIYGNQYQRDAKGNLILNTANGLPLPTTGVAKIGNPNPRFTMGITNTFSYKGFTLDFLVDIRAGGDIYSRDVKDLISNGATTETTVLPRFAADNTTYLKNYQFTGVDASGNPVNIPITAEQYFGSQGIYTAAEGFILKTSWVRVREANLSYRLPKRLLDRTPFGAIDLGVFAHNLFLWTKYPHYDPEQNLLGTSNFAGIEYNAQPVTTTVGVSLRVTL